LRGQSHTPVGRKRAYHDESLDGITLSGLGTRTETPTIALGDPFTTFQWARGQIIILYYINVEPDNGNRELTYIMVNTPGILKNRIY
jgi:hypothetical protein